MNIETIYTINIFLPQNYRNFIIPETHVFEILTCSTRDLDNLQLLEFYFMLLSGFVFIYEAFVDAGQVLMHIDFCFFSGKSSVTLRADLP